MPSSSLTRPLHSFIVIHLHLSFIIIFMYIYIHSNIGLPFYGRSFAGSGLTGLYQPFSSAADTITWSDDEGTPQYFNIAAKINQFTSIRDEQTMTQIAYGSSGLVSYDDERAICEKTEYAMEHDLNGYIIWEISGDIMPDLSTPLLDATNYKLTNPDVSCASKYGEKVVVETTAATTGEDAGVSETVNGNSNNDGVNPFYAHLSTGVCVNDGKQYGYLKDDQLYVSFVEVDRVLPHDIIHLLFASLLCPLQCSHCVCLPIYFTHKQCRNRLKNAAKECFNGQATTASQHPPMGTVPEDGIPAMDNVFLKAMFQHGFPRKKSLTPLGNVVHFTSAG